MLFLGTTSKKNVTVRWAKFLFGKVGKGIILKIIMPSKLGGALKHCLCSSPFGGNDPTWLICFQVGWNLKPSTRKGRGHFKGFFSRCFSVIFRDISDWKLGTLPQEQFWWYPSLQVTSFPFENWWFGFDESPSNWGGGAKHGPLRPEGFRDGRCQGS